MARSADADRQLSGPSMRPGHGGPASSLVVLLHGVGADGSDLIALAPVLGEVLPGAHFASPHAPFAFDMAPFGRQWFSLRDRGEAAMLDGVRIAAPLLDAFLDSELAKLGLDESRAALVGFSQGTMMSLHVAPRRARPCACVIGFSGHLVGARLLAEEARSKPPVLLVHGETDDVVPVAAMRHAQRHLQEAGFAVDAVTRPDLPHAIDEEGIVMAAQFLRDRLGD
ncbi:MAG: prolyl oligopeptidase family serine peptidase [Alphaproteobacteria bacterium]|nr:prolyl oligopeptidase family serine peptidase [Alphaproteobacteria bacterium]